MFGATAAAAAGRALLPALLAPAFLAQSHQARQSGQDGEEISSKAARPQASHRPLGRCRFLFHRPVVLRVQGLSYVAGRTPHWFRGRLPQGVLSQAVLLSSAGPARRRSSGNLGRGAHQSCKAPSSGLLAGLGLDMSPAATASFYDELSPGGRGASKLHRSSSWKRNLAEDDDDDACVAILPILGGGGPSGGGGSAGGGDSSGGGGSGGGHGGSGSGGGSHGAGGEGHEGNAVSVLVLLLGLTATGVTLLRFEMGELPERKIVRRASAAPGASHTLQASAISIAGHYYNDSALRHAAKTFKAQEKINAEAAAEQARVKKRLMKKLYNPVLIPTAAVLGHVDVNHTLTRRKTRKRRTKDNVEVKANLSNQLEVAISKLREKEAENVTAWSRVVQLEAELTAVKASVLRSHNLTGESSDVWDDALEALEQMAPEVFAAEIASRRSSFQSISNPRSRRASISTYGEGEEGPSMMYQQDMAPFFHAPSTLGAKSRLGSSDKLDQLDQWPHSAAQLSPRSQVAAWQADRGHSRGRSIDGGMFPVDPPSAGESTDSASTQRAGNFVLASSPLYGPSAATSPMLRAASRGSAGRQSSTDLMSHGWVLLPSHQQTSKAEGSSHQATREPQHVVDANLLEPDQHTPHAKGSGSQATRQMQRADHSQQPDGTTSPGDRQPALQAEAGKQLPAAAVFTLSASATSAEPAPSAPEPVILPALTLTSDVLRLAARSPDSQHTHDSSANDEDDPPMSPLGPRGSIDFGPGFSSRLAEHWRLDQEENDSLRSGSEPATPSATVPWKGPSPVSVASHEGTQPGLQEHPEIEKATLAALNTDAYASLDMLEIELDESHAHTKKLQAQVSALQAEQAAVSLQEGAALVELQADFATLAQQHKALQTDYTQALEERLRLARAQRNRLLAAFDGLAGAEDDIETVVAKLEAQATENTLLKQQHEHRASEIQALEERLKLARTQRNRLLAAFDGMAGAEEDIDSMLSRLEAQAAENKRNKLLSASTAMAMASDDVEALAGKLEAQSAETETLRQLCAAQTAELQAVHQDMAALKRERDALRLRKGAGRSPDGSIKAHSVSVDLDLDEEGSQTSQSSAHSLAKEDFRIPSFSIPRRSSLATVL
ncbi:hypothetical protein WJX72_009455 [[Myrmecia] bisecta]|uniref:Uncharacterized protein n=1 Tax=[Myrmecia] bisecta TaxID=41462 RepID=A0AAW1QS94_9CHLO